MLTDYVELVRAFDTWDWEATGNVQANQLNLLFYLAERGTFADQVIGRLRSEDVEQFTFEDWEALLIYTEERRIAEFEQKKAKQMKRLSVEIDLDETRTYNVGVVFWSSTNRRRETFCAKAMRRSILSRCSIPEKAESAFARFATTWTCR